VCLLSPSAKVSWALRKHHARLRGAVPPAPRLSALHRNKASCFSATRNCCDAGTI